MSVDEASEWCSSFVLVPKANGKVWMCLDLARLNKALIRPVHRDPTLKDILLDKYLTLIDASSGLLSGIPNVFSITDDILIAGFYEQDKDHGETSYQLLWYKDR